MSNPITNARHLLRRRDATAKHVGYMDRELAEAMRALLAEADRMRAEDARCLDAIDAATREDERRHAEVVKAAMERERLTRELDAGASAIAALDRVYRHVGSPTTDDGQQIEMAASASRRVVINAHIDRLERERDEAQALLCTDGTVLAALAHLDGILTDAGIRPPECNRAPSCASLHLTERIHRLADERDEARAEVERLQTQAQAIELALGAGEHLVDRSGAEPRWRTLPEAVAAAVGEVERLRALVPESPPAWPACGIPVGGADWWPCALPAGHDGHHASAARLVLDAHQAKR